MNDFVRNMHTESGLINEVETGLELEAAEQVILDYIKKFVPNAKEAPLAGNTIGTDRMFLNKYMPALDQHLHYRNIDVSSIKELTRRWYPRVYFQMPKKDGGHRALADILESIQELRYYRETVMVPVPGPTTEEARAAAENVSANL
jgi:oligoribonuclease